MLSKVVIEDPVIKGVLKLTENILRQDGVIEETVQLLKYVTQRKETMDMIADYYQKVFLRTDVKDSVKELLAEGAYQGLAEPMMVKNFAHFMVKVVNTDKVRDGVFEAFVYKPMRNTFWFLYWK